MIYTSNKALPDWFIPSGKYIWAYCPSPIKFGGKCHPTIINTETGMAIPATHNGNGATGAIKNWSTNPWKCHPGITYFKGKWAGYNYTPSGHTYAIDNALDAILDAIFAKAEAAFKSNPAMY